MKQAMVEAWRQFERLLGGASLTVRREGYERPVDECEDRCLKEMEERLRELGPCSLTWTDRRITGKHSDIRPLLRVLTWDECQRKP